MDYIYSLCSMHDYSIGQAHNYFRLAHLQDFAMSEFF